MRTKAFTLTELLVVMVITSITVLLVNKSYQYMLYYHRDSVDKISKLRELRSLEYLLLVDLHNADTVFASNDEIVIQSYLDPVTYWSDYNLVVREDQAHSDTIYVKGHFTCTDQQLIFSVEESIGVLDLVFFLK